MTETKFTPGPWEALADKVYAPGESGANICVVSEPRATETVQYTELRLGSPDAMEAFANANLIAASPALYGQHESNLVDLDFLRKAIECGDPKRELLVRISDIERRTNAALSQARGEK